MMRDVGEAMNTVALTRSVLLVVNQALIVKMEKCAVKWFTNAKKTVSVNLAKLATTVEARVSIVPATPKNAELLNRILKHCLFG
jgi:hypothetical protein